MSDSNTAIGELTVEEVLEHLAKRLPVMVFGALVPDDDEVMDTMLISTGNRVACLGLATLLGDAIRNGLMENRDARGLGEPTDGD